MEDGLREIADALPEAHGERYAEANQRMIDPVGDDSPRSLYPESGRGRCHLASERDQAELTS